MALTGEEWTIIAVVLGIIFVLFAYNRYAAAAPAGGRGDDGPSVDPMLSRFVVHDGSVIGEVMALEEDAFVVKHKGNFRVIDRNHATLKNDEVHLTGDIDWAAADAAGLQWLAANRKGQDDAITAHLTTSADIKNPAGEAFTASDDEEE